VRVSSPDKGFDKYAWVRLIGYTVDQVTSMLAGTGAVVTDDVGREVTQVASESVPYVTAALSAYGTVEPSKGQDDAAQSVVRFGRRLLQRIFGRKDDGEPLPSVLAKVAENPGDPDYLGALRAAIRAALESDAQMLTDVREILARAETSTKEM
jgi:hypothetical protein